MKRKLLLLAPVAALVAFGLFLSTREAREFRFTKDVPVVFHSRTVLYPGTQANNMQRFTDRYATRSYLYREPIESLKPRVEKELAEAGFKNTRPNMLVPTVIWHRSGPQAGDGSYPDAMFVTIIPGYFDNVSSKHTYASSITTVVIQEPKKTPNVFEKVLNTVKGWF